MECIHALDLIDFSQKKPRQFEKGFQKMRGAELQLIWKISMSHEISRKKTQLA